MSASKRMLVVGKLKGKKRGGDSLGSNSFSRQDIRRDFDIPRFRQSEDSTIAAPEEWVEQEIDRKEREDFIRAMQDQAVKDDLIRTGVFVAIFLFLQ